MLLSFADTPLKLDTGAFSIARSLRCDTLEPVVVYRRLNAADNESAPHVVRKLQKWRDNQRWKTTAKWQGDADNDTEPRFVSPSCTVQIRCIVHTRSCSTWWSGTPEVALLWCWVAVSLRVVVFNSLSDAEGIIFLFSRGFFPLMRDWVSTFLVHGARWKQEQKWKGNNDDTDDSNDPDDLPKWKRNQKWKSNV